MFAVRGVPWLYKDGWEAVDGEDKMCGELSTHANSVQVGTIYPGLYQHDFGVINETDIYLTIWRELCGKDLQSCFTHLVRITSCGPPAGIGPPCFSFLCGLYHSAEKH